MYAMYPYATIREAGRTARLIRCPSTDANRARRWARWLLTLETVAMRCDHTSREITFHGVRLSGGAR